MIYDGENIKRNILTWSREAFRKRITSISNITDAYGAVVDHFTLRIDTTRVHARGRAFLINARKFPRTFTVYHAFGSTSWWASNEICQAGTHSMVVDVSTLTIRSAWRRTTGVWLYGVCCVRENCIKQPTYATVANISSFVLVKLLVRRI